MPPAYLRNIRLGQPVLLNGQRLHLFQYADIESLALICRRHIIDMGYEAIIAIARGGLYLAAMVSQSTDVPLRIAHYDRRSRSVRVCLDGLSRRVLLVEDVAGRGNTLRDVADTVRSRGVEADTMVVCWDEDSQIIPTLGVQVRPNHRCWFPWERTQRAITAPTRAAAAFDLDLPGWRTAFDLQVFELRLLTQGDSDPGSNRPILPTSVSSEAFRVLLPPQWRDGDFIIGAVAIAEEERLHQHLARLGILPSAVLLHRQHDEPVGTFKSRVLAEHQITEYFECDEQQAASLASNPSLVVWHYQGPWQAPRRIS